MIRFRLSGKALDAVAVGNWRNDNPSGWAALVASPTRKAGRGSVTLVEMASGDAADLADYLESVAQLWDEMSAAERGEDRSLPLHVAVTRIRRSLRDER